MKPVVIFGVGGFADQVYHYFKYDSQFDVRAFTVDQKYMQATTLHGLPVTPFETINEKYPPSEYDMFVAVAYSDLNRQRAACCAKVRAKGYKMVNYFHSSSLIPPDLVIGENCFFMEKVVFQPFSKVGDGVVVLTDTGFGHNAVVGDFCYISGGCCIAAQVEFGPYCFVSLNATFRPNLKIGESVIVGAGALLLEDAPAESVYIARGTPRAPRSSKLYKKFI